jgi:hypothetical protein
MITSRKEKERLGYNRVFLLVYKLRSNMLFETLVLMAYVFYVETTTAAKGVRN